MAGRGPRMCSVKSREMLATVDVRFGGRREHQPRTLRHRSQCQVHRLPFWWGQCQFYNFADLPVRNQWRPRRSRCIIQKSINTLLHKTLLPAIHCVLRLTRTARTISTVPYPLALSRMIRARQTCFCYVLGSMAIASRRRRFAPLTV